jgi:integrase
MTVDLNLPPAITDEELAALWDAFSRACEALGIAVISGHTALRRMQLADGRRRDLHGGRPRKRVRHTCHGPAG